MTRPASPTGHRSPAKRLAPYGLLLDPDGDPEGDGVDDDVVGAGVGVDVEGDGEGVLDGVALCEVAGCEAGWLCCPWDGPVRLGDGTK
jgi:hypothetical protein